ncbi:hypothetical protein OM392_14460 [Serratia bockelmannii]|uniref:hypothetical protein n=1 Tax=Serratia bockelmannii TaxID=2703793 RepID=UPI00223EB894|nr:hypothetical protein [Serratia bockelmannii]MCW7609077.1 hypothetical protein [Serratia bockelmannii]
MKNIVENQDIKTDKPLPMSYEALKAERDALAVENAALKVAVDGFNQELYGKGFEVLGWHLNGDTEPLDNWFGENDWNPETPATSAALAAIQAQGVEKFADDLHKTAMALCSVKPDNTTPGAYAGMARAFAIELREAK